MNRETSSSDSEDLEDSALLQAQDASESGGGVRSQLSTSDSSSTLGKSPRKMNTFDVKPSSKDRGTHMRVASDGDVEDLRGSISGQGVRAQENGAAKDAWPAGTGSKYMTEDSVMDSVVSTESEVAKVGVKRLALPRRTPTRGTLDMASKDDETGSMDGYSDSATSQNTVPEVPVSARNRSGSLTSFHKTLAKNVGALEDNPNAGASPPHSIRDGTSHSSLNSLAVSRPLTSKASKDLPVFISPRSTSAQALLPNSALAESQDTQLSKTRISAIEWILNNVIGDRTHTLTLDQVIRNRDFCENRRPYERLIQTFVLAPSENLSSLTLELINCIIPEITVLRRNELFEIIDHSNFIPSLHKLLLSERPTSRSIAKSFERLYIEHLHHQATEGIDMKTSLAGKLEKLMRTCEPLNCFPSIVWQTSSRLGLLSCVYLADQYPSLIRKVLDENEAQTPDCYCLPTIAGHLALLLTEILLLHAPLAMPRLSSASMYIDPSEPTLESDDADSSNSSSHPPNAVVNHVMSILFSQNDGYYELFCMVLLAFDATWRELKGNVHSMDAILEKTKHLLVISLEASSDIPSLKAMLMVDAKLSSKSGGNPSPGQARQALTSIFRKAPGPVTASELRSCFSELMLWISSPVEKSTLPLLADAVAAMRTLASQPNFFWEAATSHLLFHLLRNIGGSDGSWMRHWQLASQVALWIDYQVNTDPRGPSKVLDALDMIAIDHSAAYCLTKPLVRMLRSNRQLSVPLRIINRLFEYKDDEVERKAYLSDLARSQALSIMQSKVWSTFAEVKHELLRFQSNLLTLDQQKFDPSARDHESLLADCWHAAFPAIRLRHVGPQQWALLGFRKFSSISGFRGVRIVSFIHLLHFARTQNAHVQHIILCQHPTGIALGDSSFALSNLLLRLFSSDEYLMPMIFDEGRDGFSEIHGIVMLWMVQAWLMEPNLVGDALLSKAEAHLISVMKSHKPATAEEFSSQLGISNEILSSGWTRMADRLQSASVPLLMPQTSRSSLMPAPEPTTGSSPANVAKLRRMLGAEGRDDSPLTASASVSGVPEIDFLQEYLMDHKDELDRREHELSEYIDTHSKEAKKGRQRGSSRAEKELAETERLSRSIASTKIFFSLDNVVPLSEDDKNLKEIVKQRKAETKEQKEAKAAAAKHKLFRL